MSNHDSCDAGPYSLDALILRMMTLDTGSSRLFLPMLSRAGKPPPSSVLRNDAPGCLMQKQVALVLVRPTSVEVSDRRIEYVAKRHADCDR